MNADIIVFFVEYKGRLRVDFRVAYPCAEKIERGKLSRDFYIINWSLTTIDKVCWGYRPSPARYKRARRAPFAPFRFGVSFKPGWAATLHIRGVKLEDRVVPVVFELEHVFRAHPMRLYEDWRVAGLYRWLAETLWIWATGYKSELVGEMEGSDNLRMAGYKPVDKVPLDPHRPWQGYIHFHRTNTLPIAKVKFIEIKTGRVINIGTPPQH